MVFLASSLSITKVVQNLRKNHPSLFWFNFSLVIANCFSLTFFLLSGLFLFPHACACAHVGSIVSKQISSNLKISFINSSYVQCKFNKSSVYLKLKNFENIKYSAQLSYGKTNKRTNPLIACQIYCAL